MDFTTDSWQTKAKDKYRELTRFLSRGTQEAGFLAYGALTSLTLWPLVEYVTAAAQNGQPFPLAAIMALGSVAGGVGGNLLASQIQAWYENAANGKPPSEEEILSWLKEHALSKEDIRADIDKMLQTLEAIPNAQAALPEHEWQAFVQQLLQELAQIGNLPRYQATLVGSGILVQGDNNVVVGAGGVHIAGNVDGDVVTGTKIDQILDPDKPDPQALRRAYLSRTVDERNQLLLGGIDPKAATEAGDQLKLSAVYTALLTESSWKKWGEWSWKRANGRAPSRLWNS